MYIIVWVCKSVSLHVVIADVDHCDDPGDHDQYHGIFYCQGFNKYLVLSSNMGVTKISKLIRNLSLFVQLHVSDLI